MQEATNEEQLKSLQLSFSNKQQKLLKEITPLVGPAAATALISMQGVERASQAEINVIAHLISQFSPITVANFQKAQRAIVLNGRFINEHIVLIRPQYKVENRNINAQPWAIDLVIELLFQIGNKSIKIATIGIEYDGHASHYIESGIKSRYMRDAHILSEKVTPLIRISPEGWGKDPEFFKKCIRKYLRYQLNTAQSIQRQSTFDPQKPGGDRQRIEVSAEVSCPVCEGERFLGTDYCSICHGLGRVSRSIAENIDLSDHQKFTCPGCKGEYRRCQICWGSGSISREKAMEITRSKQ